MGAILVLVIFLFILPTYNLVQSYGKLQENEKKLVELETRYEELVDVEKQESQLVTKLKDEDYATKYVRAKYQYSKEGNLSTIFQGYRMTESILQIVEQFLQHSDEKLEELSQKNRELKLEEKET